MNERRITIPGKGDHARLSLTLHPRLTVLVGPNGSGKTRILDRLADAPPDDAPSVLHRLASAPLEVVVNGDGGQTGSRAKGTDGILDRIFPGGRTRVAANAPQPDGELAVRVLAGEIASRRPALVLIDLPELFLDPDAQRRIMPVLLDAFPLLTFVIATHSPLVAASVRDARLYRMARNADATGKPGKWTAVECDLHREAMAPHDFLDAAMGFDAALPLWADAALADHVARVHALDVRRGGEKRAWAELKRKAEEAGVGRLLLDAFRAFGERVRR